MMRNYHLLPSQSGGRRRLATVLIAAFAGEPLYKHGNHETLKQEADGQGISCQGISCRDLASR